MEEKRFATVMWGGFDFIADAGGSDPDRQEWLMECSGLQASHACIAHHSWFMLPLPQPSHSYNDASAMGPVCPVILCNGRCFAKAGAAIWPSLAGRPPQEVPSDQHLLKHAITCHIQCAYSHHSMCGIFVAAAMPENVQGHSIKATLPVSMQIIDRLCASAHYRQAVSCENSGASMAASPSSDCLLRVAMSHQKMVHLPASPQQAAASAAAGHSSSNPL